MISVGIDVSKGKSTVCILKPYGEIVSKPFNITHTQKDLNELSSMLFSQNRSGSNRNLSSSSSYIFTGKRIFCFCN